MPTTDELLERIVKLEATVLKLSRKVYGDKIEEVKVSAIYKLQAGQLISTTGYISNVEHKTDRNNKPWQSFKLNDNAGKYQCVKHFGEWPKWAAEGMACVIEEAEIGSYNNKATCTVRKWRAYGQAAPTNQCAEPAMKMQAPLIAKQTFAPDSDGPDDKDLPF